MTTERCEICGAAAPQGFSVCSTGCDLARRLPMSDQGLPATWQLGVALGLFFLLFNQLLFTILESLSILREAPAQAANFGLAAIGCGTLALFLNVFLFAVAQPKRASDHTSIALIVLALAALQVLDPEFAELRFNFLFFAFNLLGSLWLGRGLWRLWASKKREKGEE
jgi:hypothetical protein